MEDTYIRSNTLTPNFLATKNRRHETDDVVTFDIPLKKNAPLFGQFKPGQFNMLYAFGIGEVPISISGDPDDPERLVHTIRAVGPVSEALTKMGSNDRVGVRGPYGTSWPVEEAAGSDVLVIAGGIGLAPLRPALYHLIKRRSSIGRFSLLYGARTPKDLLFHKEIESWRRTPDMDVRVTVDHATKDWIGDVGLVTKLLDKVRFDPADTIAMICGPETMIRFTAKALEDLNVASDQIYVSMERNMKCAVGTCGHCQFGPHFVCKDGPIFPYERIKSILSLREI